MKHVKVKILKTILCRTGNQFNYLPMLIGLSAYAPCQLTHEVAMHPDAP